MSSSTMRGSVRRWLFVAVSTVSGLILILSYRTPQTTVSLGNVVSQGNGTTRSSSNAHGGNSAASNTPAPQTATGSVVNTQFGPVQVRVTVIGGRVSDVQAVALPSAASYSAQLSQYAGPRLRQEALTAQSATIDGVAGASYTSEGYRQSLQSALTQLGVTR